MRKDTEPLAGSNFLGKQVSRRDILRAGLHGAVGLGAASLIGCDVGSDSKQAIPTATLPANLPTPFDVEPSIARVVDLDGAQVYLNSDNLPEAYVGQDGVRVDFDIEEARKTREQAKIMGEPEVFKMFKVDVEHVNTQVVEPDFFERHPVEGYLPEDTLTSEELIKFDVEIIQSDVFQLSIRRGAFEEGELLSGYADGKRQLKVVLMDSEVVSRHYLSGAKYDSVRELAPAYEKIDLLERRASMIDGYNAQLDLNRESRRKYGYETYYLSSLELKTRNYKTTHLLSNEELKGISIRSAQLMSGNHNMLYGAYHQDTYDEEGNMTSPSVIFVAMGEAPKSRDYLRIYFDENGETVIDNFVNYAEGSAIAASQLQSYPGPDDISRRSHIDEASDTYILSPDWPGVRLRHEFAHDLLTGYKGEHVSEYKADEEVIESLRRARYTLDQNGNNNGFYFVIRLPDGNGYIFTSARPLEAALKTA